MSANMNEEAHVIDAVRRHLGEQALVTDPLTLEPWLTDWRGRWHGKTAAMLQPRTAEEVSWIVGLAAERGVPLVPQGGNTSMVGGATPPSGGGALLLSLRKLNRIRALGPDYAEVEAGVILADLHSAAAEQALRFPLTLGSRGSATLGGLTSTNAGGTQVLRFGTMRNLVLGVEAVLADGAMFDGLAGLRKDNRGYDLNQLLIGSEGTLAVVTAVRVRLVPAVTARAVAWLGLADPEAGLSVLQRLQSATDRIEAFEVLPQDTLSRVLRHIPGTRAPLAGGHAWHALVEATATSDSDEDPRDLLQRLLAPMLDAGLVQDAVLSESEAQAEAFWRIRDSISEAERASGPAAQHDISVPVDAMPSFMVEAAREVERAFPGTHASGFGHLGDGNVHFHVRAPAEAGREWLEQEAPKATRLVHDLVTSAGGSISAEHGIGQMKRDELVRLMPPARLAAMRAIKGALDPKNILNPGKLLG